MRTLVWFSCGAASAVAAKLSLATQKGGNIEVLYCELANEHDDNIRFRQEVEKWIGHPIKGLRSKEFPSMDVFDVFRKHRYISGVTGARCTRSLKREVRIDYQKPDDVHIFGYTVDEKKRIKSFERNNPFLRLSWVLRDLGITKNDCYKIIQDAGIELPTMYKLGYNNNNCIGCVKGGAGYWNKIRRDFPTHFERMAKFQREELPGGKFLRKNGIGITLDELEPNSGRYEFEGDIDCGPQCVHEQPEGGE